MAIRVHGTEATMRLLNMVRDGTPPPPKIVEHQARTEAAIAAADRRHGPKDLVGRDEVSCLVGMKVALDTLYGDWAEGIELIRWVDVPERADVTAEDVVRESAMSTESYFGSMGVEVVAAYLDACGHDRLLFRLAEICAQHAREYLSKALIMSEENVAILDDPAKHFGSTNEDILRDKLVDHFLQFVTNESPDHIKRAMVANIEWGIGNPVTAINEAGFAYCEAEVEQFGPKLMTGHHDAEKALKNWELWKAERLLELLR